MNAKTNSILTAMVMLSGCGGGLSQLGDFGAQFIAHNSYPETHVELQYDHSLGCKTLDEDFQVTVNGQPALRVDRGGETLAPVGLGNFASTCRNPGFDFNRPARSTEPVVIEITSGLDAVHIELGHTDTVIDGQLRIAPGAQVHPGDAVEIALPQTPAPYRVDDAYQWAQGATGWTDSFVAAEAEGDTVTAHLDSRVAPGQNHLSFTASFEPTTLRCEGAAWCRYGGFGADVDVDFEVAP